MDNIVLPKPYSTYTNYKNIRKFSTSRVLNTESRTTALIVQRVATEDNNNNHIEIKEGWQTFTGNNKDATSIVTDFWEQKVSRLPAGYNVARTSFNSELRSLQTPSDP